MRIIVILASAALLLLGAASGEWKAEAQTTADSTRIAPDSVLPAPAPELSNSPYRYRLRTVVLDAGHGGKDRGCAGASAREADVALSLVLALGKQIQDNMPDVKVIYTRKTNVFIELDERAAIANRNHADLFISIHCNAGPSQGHGTEVWTMGLHKTNANLGVAQRENSVILQEEDYQKRYDGFDPSSPKGHILFSLFQSAYITNSLRFAQRVERQLRTTVNRPSRGVKQAGFIVLWKSTMPSVLIELGFLTNPAEERYLNNKANQSYMAAGIYRAFREYKRELEGGS
ncbi:N-acetylmuramoyl-L-alanine amidase family protein [Hymenobacter jeongseonensis]|uniref:N-acetylmuramoyl-L-alanine amidase family protein n=1 Tax=Hymenobacter jeongseonensis TaxID=2791027 RepID=UPI00293D9545|nr:N-acetylmuramoyl-L-alanine amidase [Hymenobacter jeongseonensis]